MLCRFNWSVKEANMQVLKQYGPWALAFFVIKGTLVTLAGWRLAKSDWFEPYHLVVLSISVVVCMAILHSVRKSHIKSK